jgi:L-asparaginase II
VVESRHGVQIAVCDARGTVVASHGKATAITYYRSAAKPMQALPLVEEGVATKLGLTADELALCCASHEGEPMHVAGARSILTKAGVTETSLCCGPHPPFSPDAARALARAREEAAPIHNNCSGKHAGMLALAVGMGWDPMDYHVAEHPVQQRMLSEIERWSGVARREIGQGVDGCGVRCFAVPLAAMAASFARFADAADRREPAWTIVEAMTSHPYMVGGTGRTCSEVMALAGDRVFVKLGAEGVYCGGVRERGLGFAIKVLDGGRRAVEVALIRVLEDLEVLGQAEVEALRRHGRPEVLNTRGEIVGSVRPAFELSRHTGTVV